MNVKRQTLPTKTPSNSTNWSHNRSNPYPKPSHTLSASSSLSPAPHVHNPLSFSDTEIGKPVICGQNSKTKTDNELKAGLQFSHSSKRQDY